MDDQTARTFINSPVAGIAMPLMFTAIVGGGAGAVTMVLIHSLDATVVSGSIFGVVAFLSSFNWWASRYRELTERETLVRYEVVLWFNEQRGNSATQEPMEIVGLTPLKIFNACVHLADGGALSYRSLRVYGFNDGEVADLQGRFLDEKMAEWVNDDAHQLGLRLTEKGWRRIKMIAASPSPAEDKNVWRKM